MKWPWVSRKRYEDLEYSLKLAVGSRDVAASERDRLQKHLERQAAEFEAMRKDIDRRVDELTGKGWGRIEIMREHEKLQWHIRITIDGHMMFMADSAQIIEYVKHRIYREVERAFVTAQRTTRARY